MNIITQIGYRVLYYLWINRKTIYSIAKKYKNSANIDGKLEFKEIVELVKIVRNSGLIKGDDSEVPVGSDYILSDEINAIPENSSKQLTEYKQIGPTCAIYSMGRAVNYNTGIFTTQDEVEEVATLARKKGLLNENGMTFIDSGKVWTEYLENRIRVYRVPMYGQNFNNLVEKGYSYVTGGAITDSFFFEREDDGVVNYSKINFDDETRYYHAWTGESEMQFTDNFKGSIKFNRFINEYHQKFIVKGLFFSWAYFPILIEEKKDTKTLERENAILRRRADEVDALAHQILKANKPNDYV